MEYELMISPIDAKLPFKEFSKKQAEEYFQWHMGQINHRIDVLARYLKENDCKIVFDYSPNSLIPLWEWYEEHIVVESKAEEEYQREIQSYPEWMKEYVSTTKISVTKTMKFGADIAIYFAEVVRKNSGGKIYWGYYTRPKNADSVNRPVLMGFKAGMDMNPQTIMYNCTLKSAEKSEKTRLFNAYNVWQQYIV